MNYPPTPDEIRMVAKKATDVFQANNLRCCLFGSAGCALQGCTRTPKDVDLIVLTNNHTQEELKQILVDKGKGFYKRASKQIGATYTVLYCRLSGYRRSCKVDVLIPGIMNIPFFDSWRINYIDGLPVIPLFALLLMKLQGWSDHRVSSRADMQAKQYVDLADLVQLVAIAVRSGEHISHADWLPESFLELARERVTALVEANRQPSDWRRIGFNV